MSEHDGQTVTFTWRTPSGETYEVEPIRDIDEWTGRELRAVERVAGTHIGRLGDIAFSGLTLALSAARVVPGLTIDQADEHLTVGRIREANRQIRERRAAAEAAVEAPAVDDPAMLSPTSAGSAD